MPYQYPAAQFGGIMLLSEEEEGTTTEKPVQRLIKLYQNRPSDRSQSYWKILGKFGSQHNSSTMTTIVMRTKNDVDACLANVDWAIAKLDMHCGQSIVQTWELGFIVIIGPGHDGCFLFCFRFCCLLIVIISRGHSGLFFDAEWTG